MTGLDQLTGLAYRINAAISLHADTTVMRCHYLSLRYAAQISELLLEARAVLPGGDFDEWVAQNIHCPAKLIDLYRCLAKQKHEVLCDMSKLRAMVAAKDRFCIEESLPLCDTEREFGVKRRHLDELDWAATIAEKMEYQDETPLPGGNTATPRGVCNATQRFSLDGDRCYWRLSHRLEHAHVLVRRPRLVRGVRDDL